MTAYINTQTLQYPLFEGDIRLAYPNVSFPREFTPPEEFAIVYSTPRPEITYRQVVKEGKPVFSETKWVQSWLVTDLTVSELDEAEMRHRDQLKNSFVGMTQQRLDTFAQTRGYDGILSVCTYADSLVSKFSDEGSYCKIVRDETWSKLYDILAEVESGTRPLPESYEEIEPELPELKWPDE